MWGGECPPAGLLTSGWLPVKVPNPTAAKIVPATEFPVAKV